MIFLSASIPAKERDPKYYNTGDVIAIREAVKALAAVVLPMQGMVWGGHPAISPLIKYVLDTMDINARNRVALYRSGYFGKAAASYYEAFGTIVMTDILGGRDESLQLMREEMIRSFPYKAGVFIGGMDGVEKEFKIFRHFHPTVPVFPVASTGAAAAILFDDLKEKGEHLQPLLKESGYYALFRKLFSVIPPDFETLPNY